MAQPCTHNCTTMTRPPHCTPGKPSVRKSLPGPLKHWYHVAPDVLALAHTRCRDVQWIGSIDESAVGVTNDHVVVVGEWIKGHTGRRLEEIVHIVTAQGYRAERLVGMLIVQLGHPVQRLVVLHWRRRAVGEILRIGRRDEIRCKVIRSVDSMDV